MLLTGCICGTVRSTVIRSAFFPLELKQTPEQIKEHATLACQEMINFGTTTFCENYAPIEPIYETVKESGMRALLLPSFSDSFEHIKTTLKDVEGMLEKKDDLISFGVMPHSIYSCSEGLLKELKTFARKHNLITGIHIAETRKERYDCYTKHGKLPVDYLESIDFLDDKTLLIHSIWITKGEIMVIKKYNANVSHNPVSNMKLASGGTMPLTEMHAQGITVGLGTDSVVSNNNMDMFQEMKVCGLLHKYHRWDAAVAQIQKILDMATRDAAACLGMEKEIGSLEVGKKADLITVDLTVPHMQPVNNIISNLIYAANGSDVREVCINGKLLKSIS